ncbi:protein of unknown function (DU1801) [Marininema mesophilum]|uniref:YdhG-like domain-containing protein n=1 Tax=Marininema mesophilum TaxID=1048340 RepID=A0A1H2ZLB5_9BACL|nr:DUF1801 domain-containing protein [Marininema mesophilum]SDX18151.1 protein of unknown function (DU1801) [Marininema mesophilum]
MSQPINTVEEYMAQLPGDRKEDLARLRELIHQVAPNAKEIIKYKMPYYEQNGPLCAFASQKNYISLYILNTPVLQKNADLLGKLNIGKGCIRFKSIDRLPLDAIKKILKESVDANLAHYNDHC